MIASSIREQVEVTYARLSRILVAELNDSGHWTGELSSSALSTAVATIALGKIDSRSNDRQIKAGLSWLASNQNVDGGWGDTIRSLSNISTTALCWAAFGAANADVEFKAQFSAWRVGCPIPPVRWKRCRMRSPVAMVRTVRFQFRF